MAVHGKKTEVVVGAADMTEYFRSMDFSADVDTAESTTFRKDDKTYEPGTKSASLSLDGFYDPDGEPVVHATLATNQPIVTVGPAGLAVGARARMFVANSTNATTTAGIGDLTLLNWSLSSTEKVDFGWSLASPTELVTEDYEGDAVDTGAGISEARYVIHFHLHELDDEDVALTVESSADGATEWTYLDSVLMEEPGSVRLSWSGVEVLRYVRVTAHFNSGSGVNSKFTVAFARTAA
jgi:hypothetical protein